MSKVELIRINVNNIDAAAGEILDVLEGRSKGNVIYFNGWDGLGASATLKLVVKHLKSSTRLNKFDKVIHLDCSVWKSRRALQKVVAEELELPPSVMAIFDQCDEVDDFNGVDQGSRGEVEEVWGHIFRSLARSTFAVIFHNGSNGYVDLSEFGIPVYPHYLSNKMLWTFHGRSRSYVVDTDRKQVQYHVGNTSDFLYGFLVEHDKIGSTKWGIVHEEAKDVAECIGMPEYINHKIVEECFLYLWPLQEMKSIDWETHAFNYLVCDGIVQVDTSASLEVGDAMQSYVHGDLSCYKDWMGDVSVSATHHLQRDVPRQPPIICSSSSKITNIPPAATSFFLVDSILPTGMFQHSSSSISLRVLHVSYCTINFASPPFLSCSNLRFLLLDHCKDKDDHTTDVEEHQSHTDSEVWRACFRRLWVLDLRYTDWYQLLSKEMMSLMADLRELNVKGVKQNGKHWSITDMCGCGTSLVKLRVIVDSIPVEYEHKIIRGPLPCMSSAYNLKIIVLDGCVGLQQVIPEMLPPSVESFTFVNNTVTAAKISSISLRGCTKLKSILLGGFLGSLQVLDLSGTTMKTLDLREVETRKLKRLILLGCEKLRAILCPPEYQMDHSLEVLHINTIQSASPSQGNLEDKTKEASSSSRSSSILNVAGTQLGISQDASFDFNWFISVGDARLLRSLLPLREYISEDIRMEMDSSPSSCRVAFGDSELVAQGIRRLQQPDYCLYARDVFFQGELQAGAGSEGVRSWIWACPPSPTRRDQDGYLHLQHQSSSDSVVLVPRYICDRVLMLHVHDNSSITCIPIEQYSTWRNLRWCRVERCPKLCSVFSTTEEGIGYNGICRLLYTFWVSQLPEALYIWNGNALSNPELISFRDLVFLHLDYCPRLIHVIPLSEHMTSLPCLETLEIVCCGEMRDVFPVDPKLQEKDKIMEFHKLRRIHLYDLPMLQRICGRRMSTPNLETIKIRGCWSLRRLLAVSGNFTKRPKVDCEKDWWDNLEWDGVEANHDPSLYEPTHSRYYKKAHLPRGTVLR